MGDEELNFTEEEARGWADDPRNQAHEGRAVVGVLTFCVLLLVALIALVLAKSPDASKSEGGATHGEQAQSVLALSR
jgi:hypothetical protein